MPGFVVGGSIGGFGFSQRPNREYFYKYLWQIDMLFETGFNGQEALIACQSATLPTMSVAKESVMGASVEYKFAKGVSFDDVRVEWYDTQGLLQHIRRWREMIWTPECGLKAANDYKRRSAITHFLATGDVSGSAVTHTLFNSWPSLIRHGDLTYLDSAVKLVEVTVTYDWSEETVL